MTIDHRFSENPCDTKDGTTVVGEPATARRTVFQFREKKITWSTVFRRPATGTPCIVCVEDDRSAGERGSRHRRRRRPAEGCERAKTPAGRLPTPPNDIPTPRPPPPKDYASHPTTTRKKNAAGGAREPGERAQAQPPRLMPAVVRKSFVQSVRRVHAHAHHALAVHKR